MSSSSFGTLFCNFSNRLTWLWILAGFLFNFLFTFTEIKTQKIIYNKEHCCVLMTRKKLLIFSRCNIMANNILLGDVLIHAHQLALFPLKHFQIKFKQVTCSLQSRSNPILTWAKSALFRTNLHLCALQCICTQMHYILWQYSNMQGPLSKAAAMPPPPHPPWSKLGNQTCLVV
jgi:hypothetical protein